MVESGWKRRGRGGGEKEKGPAFLSSEHQSNSGSPVRSIDQAPIANDKKANPFADDILSHDSHQGWEFCDFGKPRCCCASTSE